MTNTTRKYIQCDSFISFFHLVVVSNWMRFLSVTEPNSINKFYRVVSSRQHFWRKCQLSPERTTEQPIFVYDFGALNHLFRISIFNFASNTHTQTCISTPNHRDTAISRFVVWFYYFGEVLHSNVSVPSVNCLSAYPKARIFNSIYISYILTKQSLETPLFSDLIWLHLT